MSHANGKKICVSVVIALFLVASIFCGTLTQAAADHKDWNQYDSGWADIKLGQSGETMRQSGCAVTAAAILMVHSGSVKSSSFTPRTLVNYLNQNGGFDRSGNLQWYVLTQYAPDFQYKGYEALSGSKSSKTAKIRNLLAQGYYIIAQVNYGQHFAAVDTVVDNTVIMMDPGSNATDMFEKYTAAGVTSLRLFRGKNSGKTQSVQKTTDPPTPPAPKTSTVTPETPPAPAMPDARVSETSDVSAPEMPDTSKPAIPDAPVPETSVAPTPVIPAAPVPETPDAPMPIIQDAPEVPDSPALAIPPMPGITETTGDVQSVIMNMLTDSYLNLRAVPAMDAAVLTVIPQGMMLTVTSLTNDGAWAFVAYDGYEGWVSAEYLTMVLN